VDPVVVYVPRGVHNGSQSLGLRFTVDGNFAVGFLRRVDMGEVYEFSRVHAASIFSLVGSIYILNFSNTSHIHTVLQLKNGTDIRNNS
jgi:hypothetical protein